MCFCVWNINGLSVSKLTNLHDCFSKFDMILLCETWISVDSTSSYDLSDYAKYELRRPKTNKAKRSSGGVLCYVRKSILAGVEIVNEPNKIRKSYDRLWLKLDRAFFGLNRHLYICLLY